jgi:predicted signal transduction protein with EAL and GGDEF domain
MGEGSILLIGNPSVAFTDVKSPDKLPVQVCARLSDGIQATVRQRFAAIAVVMAETGVNLRAGLEKLRKSTDARVVLLARMYEEPLAMELVGSACNGTGLADDYVICPVRMDTFCEVVRGRPKTVGHPQSVIASTAIEARMRQLEKLATEDDLTGLKNRRYVREFARQIIERAKKDNGRVTVLVFDIDDLKHYNDVYGHAAGDEVLKRAAVLIRRCCRRHDVVGRMGGDEFAVVFRRLRAVKGEHLPPSTPKKRYS